MTGEIPSLPPSYAALEGFWTISGCSTRRPGTGRQRKPSGCRSSRKGRSEKAQEERPGQEALRASAGPRYDDICREAAGIMEKTGDYEQVSTAYRNAEAVVSSPIVKNKLPPGGK